MGIVVSLAMLLGMIFLSSKYFYLERRQSLFVRAGLIFLVLAGLWNSIWYGLQHIKTFWGVAALVSGAFILLSALWVYKKGFTETTDCCSTQHLIKSLVIVGLFLCFMLYAVSIVRINLGLPIIR